MSTLVLKEADGTWDARVIGSLVDYLVATDNPEAVIERLAAATLGRTALPVKACRFPTYQPGVAHKLRLNA